MNLVHIFFYNPIVETLFDKRTRSLHANAAAADDDNGHSRNFVNTEQLVEPIQLTLCPRHHQHSVRTNTGIGQCRLKNTAFPNTNCRQTQFSTQANLLERFAHKGRMRRRGLGNEQISVLTNHMRCRIPALGASRKRCAEQFFELKNMVASR